MKKFLTALFGALLFTFPLSACGKEADDYAGELVSDTEILAALNDYRAGAFGSKYYYQGLLNEFVGLRVYLYRAESGTGDLYCAYMKADVFDGVDISGAENAADRFSYAASDDYIDGKHIGYCEGEAADSLVWLRLDASETPSERCVVKGLEYKLDLVLTEKTYTYLYDCAAGTPTETQTVCFIRLPYHREEDGTLAPVSDVPENEGDGYWQDEYFREQTGEYLTQPSVAPAGYGALNRLVSDRFRFAVSETDGRKYMAFPPADGMTEEEFLSFVCDEDDSHKETYSAAFFSVGGQALLDLEVLLPLLVRS